MFCFEYLCEGEYVALPCDISAHLSQRFLRFRPAGDCDSRFQLTRNVLSHLTQNFKHDGSPVALSHVIESTACELRLAGWRRDRGGFKMAVGRSRWGLRRGGDTACGPCIRANNLPPLAGAGRHNGSSDPSKNARGRTRRRAPRQRTIVLRRGRRRLRGRSKRSEEGRWSQRGRGPGPVRVRRWRAGRRRGGAR